MEPNRVVVVGQGYVGLPLAIRAVESGYTVTGVDTDPDRVAKLNAGSSYVMDIADDTLFKALSTGCHSLHAHGRVKGRFALRP